jgi:hypothetical protein
MLWATRAMFKLCREEKNCALANQNVQGDDDHWHWPGHSLPVPVGQAGTQAGMMNFKLKLNLRP